MQFSYLQSFFPVRASLVAGAFLVMAGSLFAAAGFYNFTLNSIDGKPAPLPPTSQRQNSSGNWSMLATANAATLPNTALWNRSTRSTKIRDSLRPRLLPIISPAPKEPGTNEEIKTFCTRKYSVTFPIL